MLKKLLSSIIRKIHFKYRIVCWQFNKKFKKTATVFTKQGRFKILVGSDESIGESLYINRQYELGLIQETLLFLRKAKKCPSKGNGTVIDIGANNGIISIGMLYTGEFAKAIAIEPEPRNFLLLQHNIKINNFSDRIISLPYAVSCQKNNILFELSDLNFGDHRVRTISPSENSTELYSESKRNVITVQSDQLDNLLTDLPREFTNDIAVIWIDVQGHEGNVFLGARNLLLQRIPVVSEFWPYGIKRSGMSKEEFCNIVTGIFSNYYVKRRQGFVQYPIAMFYTLFEEIGFGGDHSNIIFV